MAALSTDVATLAYLQVWDTEKQRQCRYDDAKPAESENARREQLFVIPTEQLTNWKWLPMPLNGPAVFFWIWLSDLFPKTNNCVLYFSQAVRNYWVVQFTLIDGDVYNLHSRSVYCTCSSLKYKIQYTHSLNCYIQISIYTWLGMRISEFLPLRQKIRW